MSDKYKNIIIKYEQARVLVRDLAKKRADLLNSCSKRDFQVGCLETVFGELIAKLKGDGGSYPYDEVLEEMHDDGTCCDSCYESYLIKKGPLAQAKQEFGNAKRELSYIGRGLIKDHE